MLILMNNKVKYIGLESLIKVTGASFVDISVLIKIVTENIIKPPLVRFSLYSALTVTTLQKNLVASRVSKEAHGSL